ncbi:MAG: transposase [Nanoarchaeota archaeon]|nr:transposase [Nanoarchaeota archaeon]
MIAVGLLRWYFNYQREEVQTILSARGISISTGEISNLSEEFLLRFYALHKRHILKIRKLFEKNGGVRLHLDGTGEAGNAIVFMAKEGKTRITMDAQIMPTESKKYIISFLKNLKALFGYPIVAVRDMSKQIRDAVIEVFPNTPQQICHYHFVKNIGKLIFKKRYAEFRMSIVNLKILSKLKRIRDEDIRDIITEEDILVSAEKKWVTLAIEHILVVREKSSSYPFTLPYLEIMNRTKNIQSMTKTILKWNNNHNLVVKEVNGLSKQLDKIIGDKDIDLEHLLIQKMWEWFEKIRKVLRIGRNLSKNGSNNKPTNAKQIKQKINATLREIKKEGTKQGGELLKVATQITNNCKKHSKELFVEVKDKSGSIVEIMRDNNIEERSHRWSRMHIRRRTGRNRTTNEMTKYGALLSIFSNMENEIYVKKIFSDVKDFVREIQNITQKEISDARKLIRPFAHKNIIHSDEKRGDLLKEFIRVFDKKHVNNSAKKWLTKLKLPN